MFPSPPAWEPKVNDEVFLPPCTPFLNAETAIVSAVLELGIVIVRYPMRGRIRKQCRQILATNLRPTGRVYELQGNRAVPIERKSLAPKSVHAPIVDLPRPLLRKFMLDEE